MKIIRYIFIRHFYHISFIFNLTNHYFRSILYLLAELIYFDTVMKFHHRVTQSLTEFNRFEIKRIELCVYSVVRTYYYTVTRKHPFHFIGTFVSLLWDIYFLGKTLLFLT